MPSRILRESFVTSESVAGLPPAAQDRLPRYFLVPDDFGCFLANPAVIRGRIFPLRPDITDEHVAADLRAYAAAGIIQLYDGPDSRLYGYFPNWNDHQRPPRAASKRRFPRPPKPSPQAEPANAGLDPPQALPGTARNFLPYAQAQAQSSSSTSLAQAQSVIDDPAAAAWDQELLSRLRAAFGTTELASKGFSDFLLASLKFPKSQREPAAEEFLTRGCAEAGKGFGYLLRMIEGGAAPPRTNGNGNGGGSTVPGVAETEARLAKDRARPKSTPEGRAAAFAKLPPHMRPKS